MSDDLFRIGPLDGDYEEFARRRRQLIRSMVEAGIPDAVIWREIADRRPDPMTDLERSMWRADIEAWRKRGPGRPRNTAGRIRPRYDAARAAVIAKGRAPTDKNIAEFLDIEERTVQGWRKRGLIPPV